MKRVGFSWIERGGCRHPEMMTIKGGSLCATDFPAMVGVIRHPDLGVILFDTGYDEAFLQATEPFPERLYRWATPIRFEGDDGWDHWLTRNGISAGDLYGLIISHFHGDHVAGLRHFQGLPLYCSAAGLRRVRQGSRIQRVFQGLLAALVPDDAERRARFFEDAREVDLPSAFAPFALGRDIFGDGSLLAIELPGHCPGHWGLALRTEQDRHVLLAADAAWSSKAITHCVAPPRLTTALLGGTRAYRATLGALHKARIGNPGLAILPSHCAEAACAYAPSDVG